MSKNKPPRYYVCHAELGVSYYNCDNDAMIGISVSPDKQSWEEFDWDTANEIKHTTGWKVVKIYDNEEYYQQ